MTPDAVSTPYKTPKMAMYTSVPSQLTAGEIVNSVGDGKDHRIPPAPGSNAYTTVDAANTVPSGPMQGDATNGRPGPTGVFQRRAPADDNE